MTNLLKTDNDTLLEGKLDGIGWVPRHFRLSSQGELEYFSLNELNHPTGMVSLNNVTDVAALSTGTGREIAIRAPGRNYLLRAPTSVDADKWRELLTAAVKEARGGEEVGIRKAGVMTDPKKSVTCIGPVHPLSSTFENLEIDADAKEFIEKHKLKDHLAHALIACASAKHQPQDPLAWMSEFLKKLSNEEEENVLDSDSEQTRYKENWRWYIYSAERKIDFWKELAGKQEKLSIPKEDLQKFTCFLPSIILRAIDEGKIKRDVEVVTTGSSRPLNPIVTQLDAVVVFTDASGFTALTEKLSKQPNGAEELGRFLNIFFGKLINIISFFGGDIIKFSGDAVTIMWPAISEHTENDPYVAIYRACQCCLHVHKALTNYETPVAGVKFSFHIGVGFGRVTVMQVGGIFDRWEYCIAGDPLLQIAVAEPLASSGETCLSPAAAALLSKSCTSLDITLGALEPTSEEGYVMLTGLQEVADLTKRTSEKPFYGSGCKFEPTILKKYIPASQFRALAEGVDFEEEMRNVTVIFLSIEGLDTSVPEGATMAQLLMTCCQRSVYALEGSINKFLVDDKGILLLAVFGLPPLSHFGDDPVRGVLAGLRMLDSLKAEDVSGKVGVATGLVWCGVVGNDHRKEYTVLGDVVNLSARLMSKASPGDIYVDTNTYEVLKKHDFEVDELSPVTMKGKSAPVKLFRPTGRVWLKNPINIYKRDTARGRRKGKSQLATFWTQSQEVDKMKKVVTSQLSEGGGVVVITGPAGAGKSHLLQILRIMQRTEKFTLLEGHNMSPTDTHSVPFLCWQRIFTDLGEVIRRDPLLVAELTGGSPASSFGVSMTTLISNMLHNGSSGMENWVPLLSKVMTGLEFGDTLVKAMTDADLRHQKRNQLRSICMEVLEWYSSRRPTVVILHLKQCSSFFEDPDKRVYPFARGIADIILKKKKKLLTRLGAERGSEGSDHGSSPRVLGDNPAKPCLIFVLCCRDNSREMQNPTFSWLKDVARDYGSLIQMKRFKQDETGKYLGYCFGYTPGERMVTLPTAMVVYVHEMTMGNAGLIDKIAEQFIQEKIVEIGPNGDVKVHPSDPAELESTLNKLQPPESIVGIAFSHFDRLAPSKQVLIKIASALYQDNGDEKEDYFTIENLSRAFGKSDGAPEIRSDLDQLVKDEIFTKNDECYRFCSKFWRIAAERLTLQSQKWRVKR